jgi:hypothetical protein
VQHLLAIETIVFEGGRAGIDVAPAAAPVAVVEMVVSMKIECKFKVKCLTKTSEGLARQRGDCDKKRT